MRYVSILALLLVVGCEPGQVPKDLVAPKKEVKVEKAEPVQEKKPEVDPHDIKDLEQKVNYIMDVIVKDIDCSKKRHAADDKLNGCMKVCDEKFPQPDDPEEAPPSLIDGVCVQVKLAHPKQDPQYQGCRDTCWEVLRTESQCG